MGKKNLKANNKASDFRLNTELSGQVKRLVMCDLCKTKPADCIKTIPNLCWDCKIKDDHDRLKSAYHRFYYIENM